MKPWMPILLFLLICLIPVRTSHAQTYDMVIMQNGDSIACRIDSITEMDVFFNMKVNGTWVHTYYSQNQISKIEQNAIDKKDFIFMPGTSIIKGQASPSFPRNSVYIGLSTLNYARTFMGNSTGITIAGGLLYFDSPGLLLESTLLLGGSKHFFEPGIVVFHTFDEFSFKEGSGLYGIGIRTGYRYQARSGFLLRAAFMLIYMDESLIPLPGLAVGYSF